MREDPRRIIHSLSEIDGNAMEKELIDDDMESISSAVSALENDDDDDTEVVEEDRILFRLLLGRDRDEGTALAAFILLV